MSGQYRAHCKSSLGRGLVGAAFGSGTFWSLVRAQLVQFVVAQRRGRAGARQPRQPRRQWRAGASRGEQGRAGVRAVRRAGFFRWARSVGVSGGGRPGETG